MHEFSVMSQIIDVVMAEAEKRSAEQIEKVHLEIGEFTFLAVEQMKFAFEVLTKGSKAENSAIDISIVKGTIECGCGYEGKPENRDEDHSLSPILKCPSCGEIARVKEGNGCIVREISLVIPDV